jgi:hypothetical protein
MATIFEVTLGLGCLALLFLVFDVRRMRADVRALNQGVREGMGLLAASVGAETATQRRELAATVRALPAEPAAPGLVAPAPAPSSSTKPVVRPAVGRLAQRIAEAQDAARARLKLPEVTITGEASEDEHKTLEVPVPPGMTARPPAPLAVLEEEDEPEELTTVAAPSKASTHAAPLKPPPEVLRCGYRYVGKSRAQRRSDPPADVLREAPGRALAEEDEADAGARVEALAKRAGVRIGDDENTPASGTPIQIGRAPAGEAARRRANAYPAFRDELAEYPKIQTPPPHRGAPHGGG